VVREAGAPAARCMTNRCAHAASFTDEVKSSQQKAIWVVTAKCSNRCLVQAALAWWSSHGSGFGCLLASAPRGGSLDAGSSGDRDRQKL